MGQVLWPQCADLSSTRCAGEVPRASRAGFDARPELSPERASPAGSHAVFSARESRLLRKVWSLRTALQKCKQSRQRRKHFKNRVLRWNGASVALDDELNLGQRLTGRASPTVRFPAHSRPADFAPDLRASQGDPSSSRQLLASTATEPARYERIKQGRCGVYITSIPECQLAARAYGEAGTVEDGRQSNHKRAPPGCYIEDGVLKMDVAGTNTGLCTLDKPCLCKCTVATTSPIETQYPTQHPTQTPTHMPSQVPTSQLKAPGITELLKRCNSLMNTTFNETSIEEVDIRTGTSCTIVSWEALATIPHHLLPF